MAKHAERTPDTGQKGKLRVLDGQHRMQILSKILAEYDATALVGLRTIVHNAAIERVENGETTVELPKLRSLIVSAAVARCITPIRLRGWEIKALRRIMKMTMAELARKLDERTATETVSRWESEAQPMGGYAEKLLRLVVCEELAKDAPGVSYNAAMIANLRVLDPWRVDPDYETPMMVFELTRIKETSGSIIEAWDPKLKAA